MDLPPRVTPRAFERLAEIGAAKQGQALRVAVEGGGCSGFQYEIATVQTCIENGMLECPEYPLSESLVIATILQTCRTKLMQG